MKVFFIFLLLCSSWATQAAPKSVEVWFLSNSKTSLLDPLLYNNDFSYSKLLVENSTNCMKVDGGCFNPQTGFVADDNNKLKKKKEESTNTLKTFQGQDISLVECDKGYYFDLYCGKEKKDSQIFADTGIWIDVSSSLSEFDFSNDNKFCHRRTFIEKIKKRCEKKISVSIFDTRIKQMGTLDSLCQNRGLNDTKRLISWIKSSTYKKLIIVTDIREYNEELSRFILSIGGSFKGESGTITASTLDSLALKVQCR